MKRAGIIAIDGDEPRPVTELRAYEGLGRLTGSLPLQPPRREV